MNDRSLLSSEDGSTSEYWKDGLWRRIEQNTTRIDRLLPQGTKSSKLVFSQTMLPTVRGVIYDYLHSPIAQQKEGAWVLLGTRDVQGAGLVSHVSLFWQGYCAFRGRNWVVPDEAGIGKELLTRWPDDQHMEWLGLFHSHPSGARFFSKPDNSAVYHWYPHRGLYEGLVYLNQHDQVNVKLMTPIGRHGDRVVVSNQSMTL